MPGDAKQKPASTSPETQKAKADFRLRSQQYRDNVKMVLEYMGLEPNFGNYRKYDSMIDWAATAESIKNPKLQVICHILDGMGRIVKANGKPVTVLEEVPADADIDEFLRRQSKVFVKFWLE